MSKPSLIPLTALSAVASEAFSGGAPENLQLLSGNSVFVSFRPEKGGKEKEMPSRGREIERRKEKKEKKLIPNENVHETL